MAEASTGEKTEKPTPKKLKDLRKKNSAPRSQDLPSAASLVALVLLLSALTGSMYTSLHTTMATTLARAGSVDERQALELLSAGLAGAARSVIWPLLGVILVIALTSAGYARQKPNPAALKPQWKTLHPKEGIKRIFSVNSLVEAGKGTAKLLAVGAVAYGAWKSGVEDMLAGTNSVEAFAQVTGASVRDILLRVTGIAVVIGVVDAIWQNKRFNKQSKMSKYEVTKEHKTTEGDPMIKAQIRQRGQALTRNAMVAAAADADVVVVNPTHIAIAISYEDGMPAPKVVAKGAGVIADRIRTMAESNGVPIKQNIPLARALHKSVDVGQWVPVEFYAAAAEILAAVYQERRKPGGKR